MLARIRFEHVKKAVTVLLLTGTSSLYAEASGIVGAKNALQQPAQYQPLQRHNTILNRPQYGKNIRQQSTDDSVPPPPPGPYRSSSLSDGSMNTPTSSSKWGRNTFARNQAQPAYNFSPPDMPMDMFSPDRPWPEDLRAEKYYPSDRWMPDRGSQNIRSPNYRSPYNLPDRMYKPDQSWPDSRWMPSMPTTSSGPQYYPPRPYGPGFYEPETNQKYRAAQYPETGSKGASPADPVLYP